MTGYGKAECELKDRKITVEIKSLNSKNLDIYAKVPGIYREKELEIRNNISKTLLRGKVEVVLYYELSDDNKGTTINQGVVKNYFNQLKEIARDLNIETTEQLLQMAIRLPDTLNVEREEINESDWVTISNTIKEAIKQVDEFRIQEGRYLQDDIEQRINKINELKEKLLLMN